MATTHNLTTTYAGKLAAPYIKAALLELNSLSNGFLTVKQNVVGKTVVKRGSLGAGALQDASCDFTDTSSITIDERIIDPKNIKINIEDCKVNYLSDWEIENMGGSAHKNLPKNVTDWMVPQILATEMAQIETNIYSGDKTNTGEFDGFETMLALDADLPVAQELVAATIDATTVIDEIAKVLDATPDRVRSQPDFVIGVASNIFYALVRALGGFASGNVGGAGIDNKGVTWFQGGDSIMFEGIRVVKNNGMSANVMIASYTANLWFATALLSDMQSVRLIDMDYEGSDNFRFVAKFVAAVQYGFAGDIVTYGITNAAN